MKKAAIIFCLAGFVIACNSGDSTDNKVENKEAEQTVTAEDPEVTKGLELVGKSDCFTCHKVAETSPLGPAYEAVAAKYPDNDAVVDSLSQKIIKGGFGNWGTIPMTPHPDLSEADAKAMTKYVLSLK
jgi:cytochrome c